MTCLFLRLCMSKFLPQPTATVFFDISPRRNIRRNLYPYFATVPKSIINILLLYNRVIVKSKRYINYAKAAYVNRGFSDKRLSAMNSNCNRFRNFSQRNHKEYVDLCFLKPYNYSCGLLQVCELVLCQQSWLIHRTKNTDGIPKLHRHHFRKDSDGFSMT